MRNKSAKLKLKSRLGGFLNGRTHSPRRQRRDRVRQVCDGLDPRGRLHHRQRHDEGVRPAQVGGGGGGGGVGGGGGPISPRRSH